PRDPHVITERILHEAQAPRLRANPQVRLDHSLIVGVAWMEHHPVFAEGDGPPEAIGRDVPDIEELHDDSGVGTMHDSCRFDTCRCPLWVRLSTMQTNRAKAPRNPRRSQIAAVGHAAI